jgi:hypothetical protein
MQEMPKEQNLPPTRPTNPEQAAIPEEIARLTADLARRTRRWGKIFFFSSIIAFCGRWAPGPLVWVSALCVPLAVFAGIRYWFLSSRLAQERRRAGTAPLVQAPDAPVLYLRSFRDDEAAGMMIGKLTEEEHLAKVLSRIGPVVAIGRPREYRPRLGASRIYRTDEEWRGSVQLMLQSARLVVIRTGLSAGLLWEIESAVRMIPPHRLLVIVDSEEEMRAALAQIAKVHPAVQPAIRIGWRRIGSMRAFLVFDIQWRVSRLNLRRAILYRPQDGSRMGPRLMRTLKPVFKQLQVPWQRPAIHLLMVLTLLVWTFIMIGILAQL